MSSKSGAMERIVPFNVPGRAVERVVGGVDRSVASGLSTRVSTMSSPGGDFSIGSVGWATAGSSGMVTVEGARLAPMIVVLTNSLARLADEVTVADLALQS